MNMKKSIPIVRRTMSADGSILQTIIGSSKPGAAKLQFPYEIPALEIDITPATKNILFLTAGILAGGAITSVLLNKFI